MDGMSDETNMTDAHERKFGRRVRRLREARAWSQADLADRVTAAGRPMRAATVDKIENGARSTTVREAALLAHVFGVPTGSLFDDGDDASDAAARAAATREKLGRLRGELVVLDARRASVAAACEEAQRLLDRLEQEAADDTGPPCEQAP